MNRLRFLIFLFGSLILVSAPPARAALQEEVRVLQVDDDTTTSTLLIHYWPGGEGVAQRLAEVAERLPPLPALPADQLGRGGPISIYLAPDPDKFDELAGGHPPEWSAGVAIPAARVIVLPGFLSKRAEPFRLGRILQHELAHVALHDYLAPAPIPRWFDEGYAQWAAGEWGWEGAWQLWLAFLFNRAPPLDSISLDWPAADSDARIAYLLAVSAVGYLVEHGGGEEGMRIFLERWREGGMLEPALRRTYGLTLAQFEHDWLNEVQKRYGWGLVLAQSFLFWAPLAGLVLLLTIRRRRRMLQRLDALRADEIPDSPAYWLGEEEGTEEVDEGNIVDGE